MPGEGRMLMCLCDRQILENTLFQFIVNRDAGSFQKTLLYFVFKMRINSHPVGVQFEDEITRRELRTSSDDRTKIYSRNL